MTLRFEHPEWLWAALLAIPSVMLGLRWFGAMSAARRWSAVILRAALWTLLAVVMARPIAVRTTDRLAVVAVVDVSDSVRRLVPAGPGGVLALVETALARAAQGRGPEDLFGVVVFDNAAVTVATPAAGTAASRSLDFRAGDGTNIADALALASALLPGDANGRVLLISDGNQTAGDAAAAARRAARVSATGVRRGLPIDTVALEYDIAGEVTVEAVDAPPKAITDASVTVRVTLRATGPARGRLRVFENDRPIDANGPEEGTAREVDLAPGVTVETVDVRLSPERIHRFRAIFEPQSGDAIADNNTGEGFTITPARGRVLIADGVGGGAERGPGSALAEALRDAGLDATLAPADGVPEDLIRLQEYDLVVLQNVPADAVSERAQKALEAHVRDLGGGLVMTGGRDSFGAGGWRGTVIEPMLPVKLDLPEKLVVPETAVIFVIDRSGSMRNPVLGSMRSQQEIANEAVALAIRSLDKGDLVGVVTFTDDADIVVPFAKNTDAGASAELVRGIGPGGGTNMLPGLEVARDAMARVNAKTKQVIVLSDGRSQNENALPGFAAEMAREGVRVTTIAIGDAAKLDSMRQIAERGGGAYYRVVDPSALPRVFLKAVRVVRSPMVREEPFTPVATGSVSPLLDGLPPAPELLGLTLTQARPEPTISLALASPRGEPVLAHWSVGLGQVMAFTSDAGGQGGGWAKEWIASPMFRQFWVQAARHLSRAAASRGLTARATTDGQRMTLSLEAADDAGRPLDGLAVPATVYGPNGEVVETTLTQTDPGVYEGSAPVGGVGSWIAVIKPARADQRLVPVLAGATNSGGVELRSLRSNRALLDEISAVTGGRALTLDRLAPGVVFDRAGVQPQEAATPRWREVLLWALVALVIDLATRRIAWDRWTSREYGVDVKGAVAEAVRDRGAQAGRTLSGLKGRREETAEPPIAGPAVFTQHDAAELARAQADRRRAARLAALRDLGESGPEASSTPAVGSPSSTDATQPRASDSTADDGAAGSLAAAKRRARAKFEDPGSE